MPLTRAGRAPRGPEAVHCCWISAGACVLPQAAHTALPNLGTRRAGSSQPGPGAHVPLPQQLWGQGLAPCPPVHQWLCWATSAPLTLHLHGHTRVTSVHQARQRRPGGCLACLAATLPAPRLSRAPKPASPQPVWHPNHPHCKWGTGKCLPWHGLLLGPCAARSLWCPGDSPGWLYRPRYKLTPKVKQPGRVYGNINGEISTAVGRAPAPPQTEPCW